MRSIEYYRKSGSVIISAIENNLGNQDSLENYYHHALINTSNIKLSNIGYALIKNIGFEILSNQPLKKEVMIFFEETQPRFHEALSWGAVDVRDREKFIDENFIPSPTKKGLMYTAFDSSSLYKNNYFISLIYKTDAQRTFFSQNMEEHLEKSQKMLKIIKAELNK